MKQKLLDNLRWFENSGVMLPNDGLWGVAERVAVTNGNEALEEMLNSFPAWTMHKDHCIIEQRRADCNFQAAYMYLLASEVFQNDRYYKIACNILDFLFFRSGLLNRTRKKCPAGSWNWSHIKWEPIIYFDDNSWCIFLQYQIAQDFPELDARYHLKSWAGTLAEGLFVGATRVMNEGERDADGHWNDTDKIPWRGFLDLPHWGSLTCMALARAIREEKKEEYREFIQAYDSYIRSNAEKFTVSECAYAVIGSCAAYRYLSDEQYLRTAEKFGKWVVSKITPDGNIPAEHYEAPVGKHLVDTIYTVNWALLGLQSLSALRPEFRNEYEKVLNLVLHIQDKSPEPQYAGAWRGMYDMEKNSWGGGNCFEGGAGSIYTGWTNAPISSAIAMELLKRDLFSDK